MLILTRKPGESVYIGDNIKITIVEIKGHQIRVGIDAPKELRIYREEIYLQILEENQQAAEAAKASDAGLETLTQAWSGRPAGAAGGGKARKLGSTLSSLDLKPGEGTGSPEVVLRRKRKKDDE